MNTPERTRFIGDEDALHIWWFVNGALVNMSAGYSFTAKLTTIADTSSVIFTKTTGFTGAAGSGVQGDAGVPNLVVSFSTTGEMNSVTATGQYILEIVARKDSDGSESTYWMKLNMKKRLG